MSAQSKGQCHTSLRDGSYDEESFVFLSLTTVVVRFFFCLPPPYFLKRYMLCECDSLRSSVYSVEIMFHLHVSQKYFNVSLYIFFIEVDRVERAC